MMHIKETIIVEGTYDKIKLQSIVDANILVTDGFQIFKNKEMQKLMKRLAQTDGIVILTDSDRAGFIIRNFIKSCIAQEKVLHAFIPEIKGKEKRKEKGGKEGLLGVEGIEKELIIKALLQSGVTVLGEEKEAKTIKNTITKVDLYKAGLYGKENSKEKRMAFLKEHDLPQKISPNMLIEVLNTLYRKEDLFS